MALYYDLPVYKDTYLLVRHLFQITQEFPKEYKYSLGQDMKRDALQLVRSIYRANKAEKKREHLEQFLDDFELLKLEIRLCVDLRILSIRKQAELSHLIESIGKQITGWRNAASV
ncbi:MAG: four helix bundle protein [Bacteroidales bacterium]|nr:four helix bundle protein [Bacteroidales bacterium]